MSAAHAASTTAPTTKTTRRHPWRGCRQPSAILVACSISPSGVSALCTVCGSPRYTCAAGTRSLRFMSPSMRAVTKRPSAEGEHVGEGARIKEGDLEGAVRDRARPAHELVQPRLGELPAALGVHVESRRRARGLPVDL